MNASPGCTICRKKINGRYYILKNKDTVCESCYEETDKCQWCHKLLTDSEIRIFREETYCPECCDSIIICAHCNVIISGEYFIYGRLKLCEKCNSLERCHICKMPARDNNGLTRLDEERLICRTCKDDAVMDHDSLKEIFKISLVMLRRLFNINIKKLKAVSLVSRSEIYHQGRRGASAYGRTGRNVKGVASSSGEIIILTGESKSMALETITHELGHIWQFENWPDYSTRPPLEKEGFCEWLAWHVLLETGYTSGAERMLNNRDTLYSDGLKGFLKLEKRISRERLVAGKFKTGW